LGFEVLRIGMGLFYPFYINGVKKMCGKFGRVVMWNHPAKQKNDFFYFF